MSLLFVPVRADELRSWVVDGVLPANRASHAVTAGLEDAFGVSDPEEAERIALLIASVAGLCAFGRRLIAVVEAVPVPRPDADPDFGEVWAPQLPFFSVSALFADEAGQRLVPVAARAVAGMSLAQAWEEPVVTQLLSAADLLWHGPGEWESLLPG